MTNALVAVDVLMATYNGAPYLASQLESVAAQGGVEWRLHVRDDGSDDDTRGIVESFAQRYPGRVRLVDDRLGRLGASRSFGRLMAEVTAQYAFFCDQDDVWFPDKLSRAVRRLSALEAVSGPDSPVLVHTDLEIVDTELRPQASSLNRFQRLGAHRGAGLRQLLVQNNVTGCTVGMNRALVELARPIPEEAIMHDWWVALVASAFGRVVYEPVATVAYRQHGANALGARRYGAGMARSRQDMRAAVERTFTQARVFERRFEELLDSTTRNVVSRYAAMTGMGGWRRRGRIVRGGYWKHGLARNLAMLVVL